MKDNGIFYRKPSFVGINPYMTEVSLLPRAKKKLPTMNDAHIVYHSYTLSSNGTVKEPSNYKLKQFIFVNTEIDFTLEFDSDYKTREVSSIKKVTRLNLNYDRSYYGAYTTKPLSGNSEMHGTLYEKNEETLYNIDTYVELYDKASDYKYKEYPVIDGKFDIERINQNEYKLVVIDKSGKYNNKTINVDVVDVNQDFIEPYITLIKEKENLYDLGEKFIQKILVGNCLSDNYSLSIDNRPNWLTINKIKENLYELSGIPPENLYEEEFELKFNLYDYRVNGIKEASILKKYKISKKYMNKIINSLEDTEIEIRGDVKISEYNSIQGIVVNDKNNTFVMSNKVPPSENGDFTIMFAFTMLKYDNKETKHNIFLGNTSTSSSGTFWLGTPPTTSREEPPLTISMNQAKSTQTNVFIEENRTYFVKITRNMNITKIFVNNRCVSSFNDSDSLGILTLPFMFGDGGWGNYKSNILVHEYDFINDYGDVSNLIKFKSTENIIDSYLYRNTHFYKFSSTSFYNGEELKRYAYFKPYKYNEGLKYNAIKHGIGIIDEIKSYTITFEVNLDNIYQCTLFEIGELKVHSNGGKIIFSYLGNDIYNVDLVLNQKINFDIIYDHKKSIFEIYYMGSKHGSVKFENAFIKSEFICIGFNKYMREDSIIRGTLYTFMITEGRMYSGDHIFIPYNDINIEKYDTRKFKTLYTLGYNINAESNDELNNKLVDINDDVLYSPRKDYKPVINNGVTYKVIDGKLCYYFAKSTDTLTIQADILKYVPSMDINFDFYWSGKRTGTMDTILSSNNTIDGSTWGANMFTLRANTSGVNPVLQCTFNGKFGGATTANANLKVGWNKIRIYRSGVWGYYLYCTVNGVNTSFGGSYDTLSLGGNGGFLTFGQNYYDKQGLIECAIANLSIKIIYE